MEPGKYMKILLVMCFILVINNSEAREKRRRLSARAFSSDLTIGGGDDDLIQGQPKEKMTCEPSLEFACVDGKACIAHFQECNKVKDCFDGSDEHENCSYFDCQNGEFINSVYLCDEYEDCSNSFDEDKEHGNCTVVHCTGQTVSVVKGDNICNGISDCQDQFNSDECNCTFTFVCKNKICIHHDRVCDGDDNCGDGSDEKNCQMFSCNNTNRILSTGLCDGFDNCGDSSDECGCLDTFNCTNGRCVLEHLTCDGHDDCGDTSDECACQNVFKCKNGRCIEGIYVGDGIDQCGDNSDEIIPSTTSQPDVSTRAQFKCSHGMYIDYSLLCNGYDDCKDGLASDECNCGWTVSCNAIGGKCVNVSVCKEWTEMKEGECDKSGGHMCSNVCIEKTSLCDGKVDCPDQSDEDCISCDGTHREHTTKVCDGKADCYDRADECECDNSTFKCGNGKCIDKSEVCSGKDPCGDCSSETNCPISGGKPTQFYTMYHCKDGHCFRESEKCVGEPKCKDKEDADECPTDAVTSQSVFRNVTSWHTTDGKPAERLPAVTSPESTASASCLKTPFWLFWGIHLSLVFCA